MDMSSSSDSELTDESFKVHHRLHATRSPFFMACGVEFAFCFLMTSWMCDQDEHYTVFFQHSEQIASKEILAFVWCVFGVSALVRLLCLCLTAKSSLLRSAGRKLTVMYMFFGTVNWILYLTAYYVAHDAASELAKTYKVNIGLKNQEHVTATMKKCLHDNAWSYWACEINVETACTRPFEATALYSNGECVSTVEVHGVSCCISETLKIGTPRLTLFGRDVPVSLVFMLVKWMSILLVGWVLRHGFFAAGVGTKDFSKTAYLDILDIVIFSGNLNDDLVRCPGYGISRTGRPQIKNFWPYYSLWTTFATAFTTVVMSQILYTLFAPRVEAEEENSQEETDSGDDVTTMIHADFPKQTVKLAGPKTTSFDLTRGMRPGHIVARESDGIYRVQFSDDLEPQETLVSIDALASPIGNISIQSMQKDLGEATQQGCSGWLMIHELCKGTPTEKFEKKARLLDAFRSLLCLQLPFLFWRLYLDSFKVDVILFAGQSLLIAKNAIWAAYNLVTIVACQNKDATVFGLKPIKACSIAADTKFGKLWVGPSGIVAMVAEFAGIMRKRDLRKHTDRLEKYQKWLLSEKELASEEMQEIFDRKLKDLDLELAITKEKMEFTFP